MMRSMLRLRPSLTSSFRPMARASVRAPLRTFASEASANDEVQLREYKEEELPSMPVLDFFSNAFYAAPLGLLALGTAVSRDWYVVGVETQLAVLFMMFTGTVYTQAGGMIAESLDSQRLSILKEHQARQRDEIKALQTERDELIKVEGFESAITTLLEDMKSTAEAVRLAQPVQQKNQYSSLTAKVLDTVAREEASFAANLQAKLVDEATAHARAEAPKIKDAALKAAIEGLTNPDQVVEDPVLDIYSSYITKWGEELEKTRNTEKALTPEQVEATFEKTVAAMSALGFDTSSDEAKKMIAEIKPSLPTSVKLGNI